ncbi:MAG: class I SAM-dependent RNA methyltransferase [Vicinamibacterales bacterium]
MPGDRLTLRIEKAVAGGRMLARHEGAVVLVAGALPGELVEAEVERVQRRTVWARVAEIREASAARVGEPNPCGGCVLAHARYEHQVAIKQQIVADTFQRVGRLPLEAPVPVEPSPVHGYRMRARFHVEGTAIGFFREGTHQLCDPASTRQLLPETDAIIAALAGRLSRQPGLVQAVDLSENREATERTLHLELAPGADPSRLAAAAMLDGVSGVTMAHHGSRRVRLLWGDPRVTDWFTHGDRRWALSRETRAFFQGNRYLIRPLVDYVIGSAHAGAVVDLYAGVGLFSVAAVARGHMPVVAVEGDDVSAGDLRQNGAPWKGLLQTRHEAVEDYLRQRRGLRPQTLLLDPPRTGLSRQALQGVLAARAPRVVYVSCDVPTLARDARAFVDAGYRISSLRAFDLFPNTAHVETVAVLDLGG